MIYIVSSSSKTANIFRKNVH